MPLKILTGTYPGHKFSGILDLTALIFFDQTKKSETPKKSL
jgi:hypothetical protein